MRKRLTVFLLLASSTAGCASLFVRQTTAEERTLFASVVAVEIFRATPKKYNSIVESCESFDSISKEPFDIEVFRETVATSTYKRSLMIPHPGYFSLAGVIYLKEGIRLEATFFTSGFHINSRSGWWALQGTSEKQWNNEWRRIVVDAFGMPDPAPEYDTKK